MGRSRRILDPGGVARPGPVTMVVLGAALLGAVLGGGMGAAAQDPSAGASPVPSPSPTTPPTYRVEGTYEVRMQAGAGPVWNSFRFEGEFTLTDLGTANPPVASPGVPDGSGGTPSIPPRGPDGTGRYTGVDGQFEFGQTQCGPVRYLPIDAEFEIVASVDDRGQLSVSIIPQPPGNDPLLDVFNTRLDVASLEFGSKHLEVPLDGGTFRWGGGVLPGQVECDGIPPASGGRFTVIKISGE